MDKKYSKAHIAFLIRYRKHGVSAGKTTIDFNAKFKTNKSVDSIKHVIQGLVSKHPELANVIELQKQKTRQKTIDSYRSFLLKKKRIPNLADLTTVNVNATTVRAHFENIGNLEKEVRGQYPEAFSDIVDESVFTDENFEEVKNKVDGKFKFLVTSAVTGCDVHDKILKTIRSHSKLEDCLNLIQPCSDPAKNNGSTKWQLDSKLSGEMIVFKDMWLNDNAFLSEIKLSAKHINPLTGLSRLGQRKGAFIYASPKQFLEYVPTSSESNIARATMTTGAITLPQYQTDKYMSERLAYMAKHDHILGGIIVELDRELDPDKFFHFRQVQFEPKSGAFIDLDKKYFPDGSVKKSRARIVKVPDYHVWETSPSAKKAWKEITKVLNPEYLSLEDFFNGTSINHHDKDRTLTLAQRAEQGKLSLRDELEACYNELEDILKWNFETLVMITGNHEKFLYNYLEAGYYVKDPHNKKIATELAHAVMQGHKNPFRYAMEHIFGLKSDKKIIWLSEKDSFVLDGIENGKHGHNGPSGTRNPSLMSLEKSYGLISRNHTHTPGIFRGAWQGGTSCDPDNKDDYRTGGPDAWMNTILVQHPNGSRQLINVINGKWRA